MNEKHRNYVNTISLFTHILVTTTLSLAIFFLSNQFVVIFNEKRIAEISLFLPLLSISSIPKSFSQKIMYRQQKMSFVFLSNLSFFGSITVFFVHSIINNSYLNYDQLSKYYLYGTLLCSLFSIFLVLKHLKFSIKGNIKISDIISFSAKMTTINILNSIPRNIEPFIIKLFFSLEIVGLYSAAKNLYRLFDEALNAFYGIIYPATVKHINSRNYLQLEKLTKKSISFVFFGFVFLAIIILSPLGYFVLEEIFPIQYIKSINYLTIFLISVPFLSFVIFYSLLTASNKLKNVFFGVISANISFLVILLMICINNNPSLIPFGLVSYNVVLGLIGLYYGIKIYNYKFNSLIIALPDSYNFIKQKIKGVK